MTRLSPVSPDTVMAALAEAASLGGFFAIAVGGPETGWRPADDAYADGMQDLVDATALRYGAAEMRIAASITQLGHAARLWSPVLYGAAAHGIVLDLGELRRAESGPALGVPAPRGHRVPAPDGRLAEALYQAVVVRHLDRLAAGLRVKVAAGLLYGNAASALAEAARATLTARPELHAGLAELTGELLSTGRLSGTGRIISARLGFRRRSCCLYYRVPDGEKCEDCSLAKQAGDQGIAEKNALGPR
ncbi:(2Fe-2S)-binding protein [Actinomadura sp. KC216]|uniref:(2Fe-2S)-binding protein n=1 Tax=Actinomadura sp. KC216 TaxID=2530370 RepID=UPI001052817F|nr:(2Fe-2S)-binding protein [Actinomadura sp. KC216]TDB88664.1 (2Fe-2S)-binding protein [Actinomadura sp. KC216]